MEYTDEIDDDYDAVPDAFPGQQPKPKEITEDGKIIFQEKEPEPIYSACDTKTTLYVLEPNALDGINDFIKTPNSRPFYLKKIPNTNLLIVVVNVLMPTKDVRLTTEAQRIEYDLEFPCYKLNMSFYERRRLEECYTEHSDVRKMLIKNSARYLTEHFNINIILCLFSGGEIYVLWRSCLPTK